MDQTISSKKETIKLTFTIQKAINCLYETYLKHDTENGRENMLGKRKWSSHGKNKLSKINIGDRGDYFIIMRFNSVVDSNNSNPVCI